ncbi:hypothetical protein [Streptomyces sp. NBC_01353]|uniref:hypothetical protein n=1 Tax=Streptomyces sp. NBC_01353 TaxID=2903835 RepID=UPI002E2FCCC5|nr:hypothetical protein [Streptomyces sp. NBC_01353]
MDIYRVKWTHGGKERTSVVSYDLPSANDRKTQLEAEGATDIDIVKVKPGE